jgi:exopolysaccharide production protein ExoY
MSDAAIRTTTSDPGPIARGAKRASDVIGSLMLIVLLLPVALLIAVAIAVDSRGPIVFVQRRVGRRGEEFSLVKFRTMRVDAQAALEEALARDPGLRAEWEQTRKLKDDPRVTRVGRVIRRLSLDELPQLLNVLIGTMSLVGPRPVSREELVYFGERADSILAVRPGLTGLWAVSGRSEITYEERVMLEHRYVTDWSMGLDVKILLRTVPAVARGHGAY